MPCAAPRPVPMPEPTLDRASLDELLAMIGDDPVLYADLLDTFLADAARYLAELRAASEAGADADALVRPAHTLKSNARNVGASRLAELCADLEADARGGAVANVEARVAAVSAELADVRAAVAHERDGVSQ